MMASAGETVAGDTIVARRGWYPRGARYLPAALPLLLVLGTVLLGPLLWRSDPAAQDLADRLRGPSWRHPLGTDQLGRDTLSRVLHGGRLSLGVSLVVTLVTATVGIAVGSAAAGVRGLAETAIMRVVDVMLAFPFLLVALTIAGLSGGGVRGIILAIGAFGWGTYARVARAETLRVRASPMVEAAHALGAGPLRVAVRHVLPNALPALVVLAVVRFAHTILTIAGLSFLGVGVRPPTPEWGAMLYQGLPYLERAPLLVLVPGLTVTGACLLLSAAAEGVQRLLNPARR